MGETPSRLNAEPGQAGQAGQNSQPQDTDPAAIRADITRTRAEMTETIDAIQERLSPQHLVQEAQDTLRDATLGKAENMMSTASTTARRTGSSAWDTIKQNPLPAAMAGIGLGWLVMSGRSRSSDRGNGGNDGNGQMHRSPSGQPPQPSAAEKLGETAGHAARRAEDTAGHLTSEVQHQADQLRSQARHQATRAQSEFQRMLHQQPLTVGAVAIGLGAAVGLALPETRTEDELMGEARERVMDRAKAVAEDTQHKVQRVAGEAQKAAQEEAKEQRLAA